MPKVLGSIVWKLLVLVISRPVASSVRDFTQKLWARARPDDPPRTPADPNAKWVDAIAYAALTGVGFAVGELVAQRGAGEIWRTLGGGETPDQRKLRETAEKEAAKQQKQSSKQRAAAVRKRDSKVWADGNKARTKAFNR